jgi:hypothetical protein
VKWRGDDESGPLAMSRSRLARHAAPPFLASAAPCVAAGSTKRGAAASSQ